MKHTSFELSLVDKVTNAIPDVTPGVVVRSYHSGRLICDVAVGNTYPHYDMASLTKIIFTQQAMMEAFDKGHWNFESKVVDFIPSFFDAQMTVKSLLTHTSQLDWWKPFFRSLVVQGQEPSDWQQQRSKIFELLNQSSNIKKSEKALYSDLGFLVLGFILEKIHQKSLLDVWYSIKEKHYSHSTMDFHVNNKPIYAQDLYAPTEFCQYRQRSLRGEVHDENTWALGGVSTHAGLFGSIDDLASYGMTMRSQLQGIATYTVRQKTAQLFSKRAISEDVGDWAVGYMMPTEGVASCGHMFSPNSVGHTGFTGTSCWYDPKIDLLVVILSNRVHYGRENKSFANLRPQIHNWIAEGIPKR